MRVPLLFDKITVAQLLRRQEVQNSRLPAGQSSDLMKPYGIQKLSPFRLYFLVLYDIIIENKMRKWNIIMDKYYYYNDKNRINL